MNPDDKSEHARKTDSTRVVQLANLERQYEEVCCLRKKWKIWNGSKTAIVTASTATDRAPLLQWRRRTGQLSQFAV